MRFNKKKERWGAIIIPPFRRDAGSGNTVLIYELSELKVGTEFSKKGRWFRCKCTQSWGVGDPAIDSKSIYHVSMYNLEVQVKNIWCVPN